MRLVKFLAQQDAASGVTGPALFLYWNKDHFRAAGLPETRKLKMSFDMFGFALLAIGVAIVLAATFWIQQDLLAKLDERCNAAWSDIDSLLVQRHDMIPPLVEAVKGFMKHEASVLGDVRAAQHSKRLGLFRARRVGDDLHFVIF